MDIVLFRLSIISVLVPVSFLVSDGGGVDPRNWACFVGFLLFLFCFWRIGLLLV